MCIDLRDDFSGAQCCGFCGMQGYRGNLSGDVLGKTCPSATAGGTATPPTARRRRCRRQGRPRCWRAALAGRVSAQETKYAAVGALPTDGFTEQGMVFTATKFIGNDGHRGGHSRPTTSGLPRVDFTDTHTTPPASRGAQVGTQATGSKATTRPVTERTVTLIANERELPLKTVIPSTDAAMSILNQYPA